MKATKYSEKLFKLPQNKKNLMTDTFLTSALTFFESHRHTSLKTLHQSYEGLSKGYRSESGVKKQGFSNHDERLSYLMARFPATYAACLDVLKRMPDGIHPTSILDLGCGPGTASLAAHGLFPSIQSFTLIENDAAMLSTAVEMLQQHIPTPEALRGNILTTPFPTADLVMLSYVLTEFSENEQHTILEKAWNATKSVLVLITPGASQHFGGFLKLRNWIINSGGYIAAPCPNHLPCPMANTKDWCHFKARVSRTSMHRKLKNASLGYEDEPYSYLIVTRHPTQTVKARIIQRPLEKPGHVILDLCMDGGLSRRIISRKDALYKRAKKLLLGDGLDT